MTDVSLSERYRDYIACLNRRDWSDLGRYVDDDVAHNGRRIGLSGYRSMLENDLHEIPDLRFDVEILLSDPPSIASRLKFDCTPTRTFQGLPVNGRRVCFAEHVFYRYRGDKISEVWSMIDVGAIKAQL